MCSRNGNTKLAKFPSLCIIRGSAKCASNFKRVLQLLNSCSLFERPLVGGINLSKPARALSPHVAHEAASKEVLLAASKSLANTTTNREFEKEQLLGSNDAMKSVVVLLDEEDFFHGIRFAVVLVSKRFATTVSSSNPFSCEERPECLSARLCQWFCGRNLAP